MATYVTIDNLPGNTYATNCNERKIVKVLSMICKKLYSNSTMNPALCTVIVSRAFASEAVQFTIQDIKQWIALVKRETIYITDTLHHSKPSHNTQTSTTHPIIHIIVLDVLTHTFHAWSASTQSVHVFQA